MLHRGEESSDKRRKREIAFNRAVFTFLYFCELCQMVEGLIERARREIRLKIGTLGASAKSMTCYLVYAIDLDGIYSMSKN